METWKLAFYQFKGAMSRYFQQFCHTQTNFKISLKWIGSRTLTKGGVFRFAC